MTEETRKEIEIFDVPVAVFEDVMPETFEFLREKFRKFVEDEANSTSAEDYRDWRKNGSVEIVLENDEISYTPNWPKKKYPADDIPWAYDVLVDVGTDPFEKIFKNIK